MADNINLNVGSGSDALGADDIGGTKFQRVKMIIGDDGVNGGDVSAANPLPVLPAPDAVSGFSTTALLGAAGAYSSGIIDIKDYQQVDTRVVADQDGTVLIEFMSDAGGTVVRTLSIPFVASSGFQLFSAPAFTPYARYTFTNGATPQAGPFYFETKLLSNGLSAQVLRMDGFVSDTMVASLNRSVIVGQQGANNYENVSVTEVTNSTETTHNLNVVSGARPSQVAGRTPVRFSISSTADELLYTVGVGKTLYITDIIVTIGNSNNGTPAKVSFQDSLSATPANDFMTIQAAEAPNSATTIDSVQHSFIEPIALTNGVFLDVLLGTVDVTGVITGYEE